MARFDPHPPRRPALVTGASSGIGEATARHLAAAGYPVVLGARRVERCEKIAAEIRADGHEAVAVPLDLADDDAIAAFVTEAVAAVGEPEVLVSSAGNALAGDVAGTDPDDFAAEVQVNLLGVQRLVSLVVPGMIERRRGDVVLVTSSVMAEPRPHMAAYVTAKFAMEGLARSMQMELEGTGVRASVVRPGPTATEMATGWSPEVFEQVLNGWIRWGVARHNNFLFPESVAAAVTFAVAAPRGTHLRLIEVEPEAPVHEGGER